MARPLDIPPGVEAKYNEIVDMCMASSFDYMCNGCDIEKFPTSSTTMDQMTQMIEGHEHDLERVMLVNLLEKHFVHPRLFEIIRATDSIMSRAGVEGSLALEDSAGARAVEDRVGARAVGDSEA
jgi:hypothetical protein